jgi:hypothetical protein
MADLTTKQAAAKAGVSEATIRLHIQRGKLRARNEFGRIVIDAADLAAYRTAEGLAKAADAARGAEPDAVIDALLPPMSSLIATLDPAAKDALLEGIRTNSLEPWRGYRAKRRPKHDPVAVTVATEDAI